MQVIWWDSYEVMTSNINFNTKPILQLFVYNYFVCGQSTTQQKNYKR